MCYRKGLTTAAQVTDHVIELENGGAKLDDSNLQSLCISCHNTKTALERVGRVENVGTNSQNSETVV